MQTIRELSYYLGESVKYCKTKSSNVITVYQGNSFHLILLLKDIFGWQNYIPIVIPIFYGWLMKSPDKTIYQSTKI